MRIKLILATLLSATLLVIAMPSGATGTIMLSEDTSEPKWAERAPAPTEWNQYGAPCYDRAWGKLPYQKSGGPIVWRQQLLPDCEALRLESPFSATQIIRVNGNIVPYRARLTSDPKQSANEMDYNIIVGQRYQNGHSVGYQDQNKSRLKGSSEIDFSHNSTVPCTKDMSEKFSLNKPAWRWQDSLLAPVRRCNSFQQPITVVRPGKVVECRLDRAENFKLKVKAKGDKVPRAQTNFIVVEVTGNNYRPLGKMFKDVPLSSIKHYDTYVHVDGLRSSTGRSITVGLNNILVGTESTSWCDYIKGRTFNRGEVIGLLSAANATQPHLHLETLVCNEQLKNLNKGLLPSNNWVGDGATSVGCRWNRPYWKARDVQIKSGEDVNDVPRVEFSFSSDRWGSLIPRYAEDWKP